MTISIGSLFSGVGGLDLAVQAVFNGEMIWHSEVDPGACKVLAHHYPTVANLGDVTQINWGAVDPVNVMCGGFPCQDISAAGKRAGLAEGTRSGLWSYFADAIDKLRPDFVVIENVKGLLSASANRGVESSGTVVGDSSAQPLLRAIGAVCGRLGEIGYDTQYATVPASAIGAPHRRDRVFILASTPDAKREGLPWNGHGSGVEPQHPRPVRDPLAAGADRGEEAHRLIDKLLPTPTSRDHKGANQRNDITCLQGALLATPQYRDFAGAPARGYQNSNLWHDIADMDNGWGLYSEAVERWEGMTRPAPPPTEIGPKSGKPRLNPEFSEWMMGWPKHWVTAPEIGLSRTQQLKAIGNGVVPQQAAAAIMYLLAVSELAAV